MARFCRKKFISLHQLADRTVRRSGALKRLKTARIPSVGLFDNQTSTPRIASSLRAFFRRVGSTPWVYRLFSVRRSANLVHNEKFPTSV
jgi:hypothetical protein